MNIELLFFVAFNFLKCFISPFDLLVPSSYSSSYLLLTCMFSVSNPVHIDASHLRTSSCQILSVSMLYYLGLAIFYIIETAIVFLLFKFTSYQTALTLVAAAGYFNKEAFIMQVLSQYCLKKLMGLIEMGHLQILQFLLHLILCQKLVKNQVHMVNSQRVQLPAT